MIKYLYINIGTTYVGQIINNIHHDIINQGDIVVFKYVRLYVTSITVDGVFKTLETIDNFDSRCIDFSESQHLVLKRFGNII